MTSVTRDLRRDLEKAVKQARRAAEAGARQAVQQLRVGDGDAPKDLTAHQRALRTRLRAHGRQLGDRRDAKTATQETAHLVQECAYEHWHRMLFARFLAEADLLIEPESGVAITLDEVQELAREKSTDWLELASGYAERMLPQIFRSGDPVLDMALPRETRSALEDLLKDLPREIFQAEDSLGWVYQFWQSDLSDAVNKSGKKIGADEVPAVTQLFTEDYMVLFLLHNTLGAWWAGKVLAAEPDLKLFAKDEDELRAACKVGDIDWSYLRFVRDGTENGEQASWRPAAGDFPGWPTQAKDLTILDPCAGSGHFLVFALPLLVAIRCAEEHISPEAAVAAVLRDNLFGLEIDPRCTQIAAFNLALSAWRRVGYRALPRLNLACSGLAIGVTKTEWLKLAERAAEAADPAAKRDIFGLEQNLIASGISERVRTGLERLYDLFAKAPWLGSLIDPRISAGDVFAADFSDIEPLLAPLLSATAGDDSAEIVVAAQGMAKAAQLLSKQYSVIATNVPYLGRGKADSNIVEYCDKNFPDAKQDLATVFIRKLSNNLTQGGSLIVVFPQNCFYQSAYLKFREKILKETTIDCVVTLGEEAWQAFGDRGPLATLGVITKGHHKVDASHVGIDATKIPEIEKKAEWLRSGRILKLFQKQYLQNDDFRILLIEEDSNAPKKTKIGVYAKASQGLKSGDDDRFVRWFWELDSHADWKFMQSTSRANSVVAGLSKIINWDDGGSAIARRQGLKAWGRLGIAVSQMRYLPTALYFGDAFDSNVCAITTEDRSVVGALLAFAHSGELAKAVREIEPGKKVNNGTFEVVPFDLKRWKDEAERKYGNELPTPITNDPKEWLFSGTPRFSSAPLHVAVARLVGYEWPRQCGEDFFLCPSLDADTLEKHADPDGIVCLSAVAGKQPADEKLNGLLAADFGSDWSATRLSSLLAEAGCSGKSLDDWLRDSFFVQHCELFGQRPFVWHVWDGRRDGFNALVNYHRLAASNGEGRRTLEKLIYTYLGDWIDRQRADQKVDVEGADGRLAAAEHLRAELTKILEGDPPYDIMVRWKLLNAQPIGWEPDINDGVRLNIRPLMTARPLGARSATACVLRTTPKIRWDKDGGTETIRDKDDFPWFWGWDGACEDFTGGSEFDGNRWNDLHYSRAVKQAARDRHPPFVGGKV